MFNRKHETPLQVETKPVPTYPKPEEMPFETLVTMRDAMDQEIQRRRTEVLEQVKADILAKSKMLGIDPAELVKAPRQKKEKKPAEVKYRGPNGETFSGRGRQPLWLQTLLAEGRSIEEFAV